MRSRNLIFSLFLSALFLAALSGNAATIAIEGEIIYTMAGPPIENGVVVITDGKITAVGPVSGVNVPENIPVYSAKVVTPGLIDAHSVVGLAGYLNQDHDQDQLERSAPMQPELRAIDAYNAREALVEWVRGLGVTTLHTGHGPGSLISGQTMIVKTWGDTVAEAVVKETAMIAATLGEGAVREGGKPPGTRAKAVAMLRSELLKAQDYAAKQNVDDGEDGEDRESKLPPRNLRLEALAQVLSGDLPLLVTVNRHNDIATALRLQEEFGFKLVLDHAAEAYLLIDEIKAAGVPVIVHPTMKRASGENENLSMETAARLADAGIPIALQSGFEGYVPKTRVLLFEAAIAAANGLGFERTLQTITLDAAKLLGIDDRVGSLEVGKDGDLALYNGDPFEYLTHCQGVIIDGEIVSSEPR